MQELKGQSTSSTLRLWIVFTVFRFAYSHVPKHIEEGKKDIQRLVKDVESLFEN